MKKISFLNALAVITFITSNVAYAADGTINFTGNILDTACTVNTSTSTQTVNLGDIARSTFSSAGSVASPTAFNIILENCPASVNSASVRFGGTTNPDNSSLLSLSSGQTATGVGVALFEGDGSTQIPLSTPSNQIVLDPAAANTLKFVAKYMATSNTVTAGSANATTDFTITYQ